MIDLSRTAEVCVLRMDAGENRMTPQFLDLFETALDTVIRLPSPKALVTVGTGKFYSNGLDLSFAQRERDQGDDSIARVCRLMARLLTFPAFTVAAVNGHAYGAGAMLALSQDLRVMRAGRGYFCLPEANLGMLFPPGVQALLQARLSPPTAHEAMLTARTYTAEQALSAGIVEGTADENHVLERAVTLAAEHAAKDGEVVTGIRSRLYAPTIRLLAEQGELRRV